MSNNGFCCESSHGSVMLKRIMLASIKSLKQTTYDLLLLFLRNNWRHNGKTVFVLNSGQIRPPSTNYSKVRFVKSSILSILFVSVVSPQGQDYVGAFGREREYLYMICSSGPPRDRIMWEPPVEKTLQPRHPLEATQTTLGVLSFLKIRFQSGAK